MKNKILVIDDDPEILDLLVKGLNNHGYDVIALRDGQNALSTIRQQTPHLIVLDVGIPGRDGYQICDEIKGDDSIKKIPIIITTGQLVEKPLLEGVYKFYGADACLEKPFALQDLLGKINSYLGP